VYTIFELLGKLVKSNINPTIKLYWEDIDPKGDQELDIPIEVVYKELSPLAQAHWKGTANYNAVRDRELERLKALGPEGETLYYLWNFSEDVDEIMYVLVERTLEALVEILTDTSGELARRLFMARSIEELPEVQASSCKVLRELANGKYNQFTVGELERAPHVHV
jgi:hypothetical protein